jgi:WD40 repeat protein
VPIPEEFPELDDIGLAPEGIPTIDTVEVLEEEDASAGYGVAASKGGVTKGVSGELGRLRLSPDSEPASCLAYAADHTRGLAASEETIFILDLEAQKRLGQFRKHRDHVTCLAISADSKFVLSGDRDGGLLYWDLDAERSLRWLEGHDGEVSAAAFAPNGRYCVSGGIDGSTRLWDLASGKQFDLFKARWQEPINCVSFTPAGKFILAIGDEGKVRVWSVKTGEPVGRFQTGDTGLASVTFSPAGDFFLASVSRNFQVGKWELRTGKRTRCFENFTERQWRVRQTMVVPGARLILTVGEYKEGSKPGLTGGEQLNAFMLGGAAGMAGAAMVKRAITSRTRYMLHSWDVTHETPVLAIDCEAVQPVTMVGSPDGLRALVAFKNGLISILGL